MLSVFISEILFSNDFSYYILAGLSSRVLSKSDMNFLADYKSRIAIYLKTCPYLYTQLSAWVLKVWITEVNVMEKKKAIFYFGIFR